MQTHYNLSLHDKTSNGHQRALVSSHGSRRRRSPVQISLLRPTAAAEVEVRGVYTLWLLLFRDFMCLWCFITLLAVKVVVLVREVDATLIVNCECFGK